ncbi:protein timeless isoform X4 [Uranotaenia lowii]|uniref:protein timeless isoform X4 n=1 Tax=Uranotaenia lowii TaxID=190385 RepID=UPI002479C089|nr:protein timeless isoform X4 [Uranotaenia lowii]
MEWLLVGPQINSIFGSLGSFVDDTYLVDDDCLVALEEIICKLALEDATLRTFRRAIGFGQNVKNDIIPLLIHSKETKIKDSAIRLLVNLTVPVECLLSVENVSQSEVGRHTIFELNKLLFTSKEAFIEWKATKAVIDHMKTMLERDTKLSIQNCDSINNCLLLLRNVLHVPEPCPSTTHPHPTFSHGGTSLQNQIIWNLFTQSIDKLLVHLMSCPHRAFWAVTMAQLVALMYKDQHINTLQKMLNLWFESTLSESSNDNESNTTPSKQCSGDSSPMLTSDPTSDSSDNGKLGSSKSIAVYSNPITPLGSGKAPSSNKDSDEAEPDSRKGEFPSKIIQARAAKTYQMYQNLKNSEGSGPAAWSPSSSDSAQSLRSPTTDNNQEVKTTTVTVSTFSKLHNLYSPLQMPSNKKSSSVELGSPTSSGGSCLNFSKSDTFEATKKVIVSKVSNPDPQTQAQETKVKNQVSLSETSDCGYGTQAEKESISTSSNEDDGPNRKPVHQKPPPNQKQRLNAAKKQRNPVSIQEKKELRRKKLVKRSKSNIINMKGLMHHVPTDDDISNLLKEFTVDFLLKGYGHLVQELHAQLLSDLQGVQIDTSHFFWLVTYFLKFATQLELDMEHINNVLSFNIMSYLTYEGVMLCEQLEQSSQQELSTDLKPCLRRIHLVVTAIRELLQALDTYKKSAHLTKEDKDKLVLLQLQISSTEDLKCLFVLLLRCYNPSLQSRQYLQDLIVTNHMLLLLLDGVEEIPGSSSGDMLNHIKQFANAEIMHQYGLLLENFRENGAFVNDCIFTMMHHIGGDLGQINVLFQPIILKTYSQIWETEYELCDDWSDLIEYVIHKFISTPQPTQLTLPDDLPEISTQLLTANLLETWTQEEKDSLHWYYVQCKQSKCLAADILKLFQENGNKKITRVSIIEQLREQDIIKLQEYDELMKVENPDYERNVQTPAFSVASGNSGKQEDEGSSMSKAVDDIQVLRERLLKENKGKLIVWLQKSLLDCCFVKLNLLSGNLYVTANISGQCSVVIMEPVSYHCILKKKSIPVIPWNQEQFSILSYQPFILLLHKLGFHLPADAKKMFVRIPEFWTADILYNIAQKLGPLEKSIIKFDLKYLNKALSMEKQASKEDEPCRLVPEHRPDNYGAIARFTPEVTTNWLQLVMSNKVVERTSIDSPGTSSGKRDAPSLLHPGCIPSLQTSSHGKLSHDLSIIIEATNDDLQIDDVKDSDTEETDDDKLDFSDGPTLEEHDVMSACETASVASDLTRMYVSDEEH